MRAVASSLLVGVLFTATALAQAPQTPPPQTPPAQAPPAQTPPAAPRTQAPARPRPARQAVASSTVVVKVTDSFGAPIGGIRVTASGPVARSGSSDPNGEVRFATVRPGTYRLRFEGEKVITFEREITVGGSQPSSFEVSLSPAPPPPPPPPAPKPEPAPPRGSDAPPPEPKTVGIPDFVERNMLAAREPSKTTLVACGATSVTNLVQIRDPLKDQVHEGADELLYVVGGEGILTLGSQQQTLAAGTFSVVPRGTSHTIQRRGNRGLILLSTLTDTPCK
jgi:mannose-6-phosphate isomerase-like protein (cupin superfamily)